MPKGIGNGQARLRNDARGLKPFTEKALRFFAVNGRKLCGRLKLLSLREKIKKSLRFFQQIPEKPLY
jgi:hypothetical protein